MFSRSPFLSVFLVLSMPVLGLAQDIRRANVSIENMCGAVALACAVGASGKHVDPNTLIAQFPFDGAMLTFADLEEAAQRLGFFTRAVRWSPTQRLRVPAPCIVRLSPSASRKQPHFLTIVDAKPGAVRILDPPNHVTWIPEDELRRDWDGVALYVAPAPETLRSIRPLSAFVIQAAWIALGSIALAVVVMGIRWRISAPKAKADQSSATSGSFLLLRAAWIVTLAGGTIIAYGSTHTHAISTEGVSVEPKVLRIPVPMAGTKSANAVARGEFRLKNAGTRNVAIKRLTTSCPCARVMCSTGPWIPAQGWVVLNVDVDVRSRTDRDVKILVEMADAIPEKIVLRLHTRASPSASP